MTTRIQNQLGQFDYSLESDKAVLLEGQLHPNGKGVRAVNPLKPQNSLIDYGGVGAAGAYQITINNDDTSESYTIDFLNTGENLDDTVAALILAAQGQVPRTVAAITASGTDDIDVQFTSSRDSWTVATTHPGGTTSSITDTATGGVNVPFGRFMVFDPDDDDAVLLPDNTAVAADFRLVSGRSLSKINRGLRGSTPVDEYEPGDLIANVANGKIAVLNVGGVDATRGGNVFVVIDTAGGDEFGQARSDADGGNTIDLGDQRAYWARVTPVGEVGWVYLDIR